MHWPGLDRTCIDLGWREHALTWAGENMHWPGLERTCIDLGWREHALTWAGENMHWPGLDSYKYKHTVKHRVNQVYIYISLSLSHTHRERERQRDREREIERNSNTKWNYMMRESVRKQVTKKDWHTDYGRKEGYIFLNDAFNTFYLLFYGIRHGKGEETCCDYMGYFFGLAARILLQEFSPGSYGWRVWENWRDCSHNWEGFFHVTEVELFQLNHDLNHCKKYIKNHAFWFFLLCFIWFLWLLHLFLMIILWTCDLSSNLQDQKWCVI